MSNRAKSSRPTSGWLTQGLTKQQAVMPPICSRRQHRNTFLIVLGLSKQKYSGFTSLSILFGFSLCHVTLQNEFCNAFRMSPLPKASLRCGINRRGVSLGCLCKLVFKVLKMSVFAEGCIKPAVQKMDGTHVFGMRMRCKKCCTDRGKCSTFHECQQPPFNRPTPPIHTHTHGWWNAMSAVYPMRASR